MELRVGGLEGGEVKALLGEHLEEMHSISPRESVHALDVDALRLPEITFWTVWEGNELLGCGALRDMGGVDGEIKSMRTARTHRGKGVAKFVLRHLIAVAKDRGYQCLLLETGSQPEFEPARRLYESHGFVYRLPFANYREDPNSVFMELSLK